MDLHRRCYDLENALKGLIYLAERNICSHEETYRGGAIWEICSMCGAKWADDEGGKPEYKEPKELTEAYKLLEGQNK